MQRMQAFAQCVGLLLTTQGTRIKWRDDLVTTITGHNSDSKVFAAFVPIMVPEGLKLKRRLKNVYTTPRTLADFICQTIIQENIQAWPIANGTEEGHIAVANAPWFWGDPELQTVRHVAVAVAKVDHYVFM